MWIGWAGLLPVYGHPTGYNPEYSQIDPRRSGFMVSLRFVSGSGNVSNSNLALGTPLNAAVTGTGDITNALCSLLAFAVSAISGSAAAGGPIFATIPATADVTGTVSVAAVLSALAEAVASLTAASDVTGSLVVISSGVASITGSADLVAVIRAMANAAAGVTGAGDVVGDILSTLQGAAALSGDAVLVGLLRALGIASTSVTGGGAVSASIIAKARGSASLTVTGDILSTANIGESVWNFIVENGYTSADVLRLLAAVAAGKTDITGTTVTFRDLGDTENRIVAEMTGSERTTITLNP